MKIIKLHAEVPKIEMRKFTELVETKPKSPEIPF